MLDKYCSSCNSSKNVSLFYKDKTKKDLLSTICIDCKKDYRQKNSQILKIRHREDPRIQMFLNAKIRSKKRNIIFTISLDDVKQLEIPQYCPWLNIPIKIGDGYWIDNSPSLDRIKPELGYVKNNIEIISHKANRIKNNASYEEIIKMAEIAKLRIVGD